MHEISIAQNLLDLIDETVKKHNGKAVSRVTIKIGKLSSVEPPLLQTAFDALKGKTVAENANLIIHIQEIVAICNTCNRVFTLNGFDLQCPQCKSSDIDIVEGRDMVLESLDIEF